MNPNPIFHSKTDNCNGNQQMNHQEFLNLNLFDNASTNFPTIKIEDEDISICLQFNDTCLSLQNYESAQAYYQVDQESNSNTQTDLKSFIDNQSNSQNTKIQQQDPNNPTNLTIQFLSQDIQNSQTFEGIISDYEPELGKNYQSTHLSASHTISSDQHTLSTNNLNIVKNISNTDHDEMTAINHRSRGRPMQLKYLKSKNKSSIQKICRAFVKSLMISKSVLNINGMYQELVGKQQDQIRRINYDLQYSTNPKENVRSKDYKIKTKPRKQKRNTLKKLSILGKIRYRFSLENIIEFLSDSVYNYLFRHFLLNLIKQNSQTFNKEVVSQMLNESSLLAKFQ